MKFPLPRTAAALVLLSCLALPSLAQAPAPPPGKWPELDRRVEQLRQAWQIPGMALVVVDSQRTLHLHTAGLRQLGRPEPVDADTVFQINSMTKALTALALASAQAEGRLRLTDLLADRVEGFRLKDPRWTAEVTIEDVLVHRALLADSDALEDVPGMTPAEARRRLRYIDAAAPLRSRGGYDSQLFAVAGEALAGIDGSWEAALRKRVFEPLHMRGAVPNMRQAIDPAHGAACHECVGPPQPAGVDALRGVSNAAAPHIGRTPERRVSPWRPVVDVAAGAALASAADMGRFLRAMLSGGRLDGRQALDAKAVAEVLRPRLTEEDYLQPIDEARFAHSARLRGMSPGTWALGWSCARYAGEPLCQHGGGSLGFESWMVLLPERGLAFALLANYRHDEYFIDAAGLTVLDHLLGLPPVDWRPFMLETQALERKQAALAWQRPAAGLPPMRVVPEELVGEWAHPAMGSIRIERADAGALRLVHGLEREARVEAWSGLRFMLRWVGPRDGPRPLDVTLGVDGAPIALKLGAFEFRRVPAAK